MAQYFVSRSFSLDHIVGKHQEGRRERQAKGLARLQVYHELELRRQFHGDLGRLCALEDLVYMRSGPPIQIRETYAVRHEASRFHHLPQAIDRGQAALGCQGCEPGAMRREKANIQHEKSVGTARRVKCRIKVALVPDRDRLKTDAQRACCGL